MKINDDLINEVKKLPIPQDEAILYLMAINFNLKTDIFNIRTKQIVHASGLIKQTIDNTGLEWKYSLFEGQETNKSFSWVSKEYVPIFKVANPKKHLNTRECVRRMKKFFAENPEVRKEDVLDAARLHVRETDPKYIKRSEYFIEKGSGKQRESVLEAYIERIKELKEKTTKRKSHSFKTQL